MKEITCGSRQQGGGGKGPVPWGEGGYHLGQHRSRGGEATGQGNMAWLDHTQRKAVGSAALKRHRTLNR